MLKFGPGSSLAFLRSAVVVAIILAARWSSAENRALLVGVSNYPALTQDLQLVGPANDVVLMRSLLQGKGFAPGRIEVLADGVPEAGDPTRRNILSGLDSLAEQAQPGDFIYLHFAGHGSQQPSPKSKVPPEPDGLDEIFLPRDIGQWDDELATVDHALINSEMNQAIMRLRNKGAFVWAVFDSCHSGNMTRGAPSGEVRLRKVAPAALGIGKSLLDAAQKDAPRTRGLSPAKTGALGVSSAGAPGTGGFVAFYAAQTVETTPEMKLPTGEPQRKAQGLFSYVLAETLARYDGISYRQLGQQVLQRYAALGVNATTPLWEGTALDAPVFGAEATAAVRQWPLKVSRGELSIGAGSLQQFSEGAIFAVVPTAASSDRDVAGYLRGDTLTPLSSIVSPIAYGGKPALTSDQLKAGFYARLVDPNLRLSLRVALPLLSAGSDSASENAARQMIMALRADAKDNVRIEWVDPGADADLRLLLADDNLWLLPPDGQWIKSGPGKSHSIALDVPQDVLRGKIAESIPAIAKATNLLRLASFFGSRSTAGVDRGLEVSAAVVKREGGARIPLDRATLPELHDGDRVEFVFENKGPVMVDVTALYLDSEYGISAMYPEAGRLNRIESGARDTLSIDLNADTTGIERLIVFAVDAQPQAATTDFSFLAQAKLDRTRGYSSSLDLLFRETGFGVKTRGATNSKSPLGGAEVKVFGWRIGGE